MPRIFISYRREDTRAFTGRIHDRLEMAFGDDNIFKDVDDIPPGEDFRAVLRNAIDDCDVMLVVIGRGWLDATDTQGRRRLDGVNDFVRFEIETALARDDMRVVPVLVDNAPMPQPEHLPPSIRQLAYRNAVAIRHDPDFRRDIERLVEQLNRLMVGQISGVRALTDHEPQMRGSVMTFERDGQRTRAMVQFSWLWAVLLLAVVGAGVFVLLNNNDSAATTEDAITPTTAAVGNDTLTIAQTAIANGKAPLGWEPGTPLYVTSDGVASLNDHTQPATGDNVVVDLRVGDQVIVSEAPSSPFHYFQDGEGEVWLYVLKPLPGDDDDEDDDDDTIYALGVVKIRYLSDEW